MDFIFIVQQKMSQLSHQVQNCHPIITCGLFTFDWTLLFTVSKKAVMVGFPKSPMKSVTDCNRRSIFVVICVFQAYDNNLGSLEKQSQTIYLYPNFEFTFIDSFS